MTQPQRELFAIGSDQLGFVNASFSWSPRGNFLAISGDKRQVHVFDKRGKLYYHISLPAAEFPHDERLSGTRTLQWDASGELLAILPRGNSFAIVWTASTREIAQSEAGFRAQEACVIAWAAKQQILAVGTSKGNLVLYNLARYQKVPIMGKHTRAIFCAAWSNTDILAMGASDKQVTLTRGSDGETLNTMSMKLDPHEVCFAEKKEEPGQAKQDSCTISVNVGKRNLYLITLDAKGQPLEQPLELSFQDQYGDIERHLWFGDGYILLGFNTGCLLVVSTHSKEIHEEVHSYQCLDCCIIDMAYCTSLSKAVVAGGSSARVLDLTGAEIKDIQAESVELPIGQTVFSVAWSPDGQLLTVSTTTGQLHTYLAAIPVISSAWGCSLAYCTSLQELAIMDVMRRGSPARVSIPTEPAFLALGPHHLAVGMNNKAWFYELQASGGQLLAEHDYLGSLDSMHLNADWAAAFFEGRVTVHPINDAGKEESEGTFQVPSPGAPGNVTCLALSSHFLVVGTAAGMLLYYQCHDKALLNEFKHTGGAITKVFPQPYGTRLIFEDEQHGVHLYTAVIDQLLHIEEVSLGLVAALWDAADPNVFLLSDGQMLYTYLYLPNFLQGTGVKLVSKQACSAGRNPLVLAAGNVTFQTKSGALDSQLLPSHQPLKESSNRSRDADVLKARFEAAVALHHFKEAWEAALLLKAPQLWQALGEAHLHDLDVQSAIRCYRMMGNASMVFSLEQIQHVEDKNLLSGHILALLGHNFDAAQELFLQSPCPTAALQMRKDLQHWPQALSLAHQLDPSQVPALACSYAQQLEMRAEYGSARAYYQQAMNASELQKAPTHDTCQAGMARTSLHMGDIKQGRALALGSNSPQLCKECAQILESQDKQQDAAELYERAGLHEKAAAIYIQAKAFALAAPLMALIPYNPKLQLEYAKAKEGQGEFAEAAVAYEAAGDLDSLVRLHLDKLKSPHKAAALVRKAGSREAAQRLAQHCIAARDYQAAVEFLLMAKQPHQAFDIAQTQGQMDAYVRFMGSNASSEDSVRIALYYEARGNKEAAAELYARNGQPQKALSLYMQAGGESLKKAIDLVAKEQDSALTEQLTQNLEGQLPGASPGGALASDDISKSSTYLVLLYMALGRHAEAAEVAIGVARRAQEAGNYKVAHEQLVQSSQRLREQGQACPNELMRSLMLLHSYVLVKTLVRLGDHPSAARMLVRVARNITSFPKHVVPILTSTVIECQRAEMKSTAFEYAAMLMRPEYRDDINPAYKRKIEAMVRKRDKADEADEQQSPCPFCGVAGPETEMDCIHCQNIIPFCIASGKRMTTNDWAECPSCHFPCRLLAFKQLIAAQQQCPMCDQEVLIEKILLVKDPLRKIS